MKKEGWKRMLRRNRQMHNDHDVLLRWRTQLTDIEVDTFIPLFVGRLDGLGEILNKMLEMLEYARNDKVFIHSVEQVINPGAFEKKANQGSAGIAYCDGIEKTIKESFLAKIQSIELELKSANTFREFAKSTAQLDMLCQSIIQNKANLFLFSLRPFAEIEDKRTGQIITTEPVHYSMILRPFEIWLSNLNQIAETTSATINTWRKSQLEWKTDYLNFRAGEATAKGNRMVLYTNIATVVVAISLSCLFLFIPDILNLRKENQELKERIQQMTASQNTTNTKSK